MDGKGGGILIKSRQFKPTRVKLLVIDDKTGVFHVQDLHYVLVPVYKYKHAAFADMIIH